MEQKTFQVCRFCLKTSREFKMLDESHHEILYVLLLNVDLAISHEPVMCKTCTDKLQKCHAFKTASLLVKGHLGLHSGVKACIFCNKIMLFDSFVLLSTDQLDVVLFKSMVEQFFPELNLLDITHPVVCLMCNKFLRENFDFLICCLNIEEQIKKYCEAVGTNNKGQIELQNIACVMAEKVTNNSGVKIEECLCRSRKEIYNKTKILNDDINKEKNNETLIASDCVKVERIWDEHSDVINQVVNNCMPSRSSPPSPKCIKDEIKANEEIKIEEMCLHRENAFNTVIDTISESIDAVVKRWQYYKQETAPEMQASNKVDSCQIKRDGSETIEQKESNIVSEDGTDGIKDSGKEETICRKEWWSTIARASTKDRIQNEEYFSKSDLRTMITIQRIAGEKKYQCQVCLFVARAKCSMNRHMMLHQNPSELTFYHCHQCGFKSKRKGDLVHHMVSHSDRLQGPLYQCKYCPFETRIKRTMKFHMVRHSDSPEVPMFECHVCGFKTCSKSRIILHVNNHRKPKSEPMTYSCDKCSYQTRNRAKLRYHFIIHMHPSELLMHRCDSCNYESKHKSNLRRHKESHRAPVECTWCEFNSKFPKVLRRHYQRAHNTEWVDDKS